MIGNVISFLFITTISFLGGFGSTTKTLKNDDVSKNTYFEQKILKYDTTYNYNSKIPSNISKVVEEGENGIVFVNNSTEIVMKEIKNEVVEVGTGKNGDLSGRLTGYGPDCPGCSVTGTVSCQTEYGTNFSLYNNGTEYTDDEYGSVRIIAAATSEFPCGTIVHINNNILEPFYAVVLDTGYDMRKAWTNGVVHFDLAFASQESVTNVSNSTAKFDIMRWGW
jgi:3D (Asp-Asp-Asp) domain-containing protein